MQSIILKLRSWWETADRTQKSVTIFGSIFLVCLIVGTMYFAGKPKMDVLFRNLSPQDQGSVANELTKMGIPFEQDRSGAIMVPASRIAEVQGKLAVAQKLPSSGQAGYQDLEKLGIMNTPTAEREKIRAILEGEISRSIEQMDGVATARIHLTNPRQTAFVRDGETASASVVIKETTDGALTGEHARAIQRLVQFAVPSLTAQNITVITAAGRTLIDGESEASGGGVATERMHTETQEAKRREAMLQARMDSVFGKGNTVVSVPLLELNFDKRELSSTERMPTKPIYIEKNTESMGANANTVASGPVGTPSNTPGDGATSAAGGGNTTDNKSYTGTQEAKQMEVTETRTNTVYAPGNLKRLAINVLVNKSVVKDEATVRKFLNGELGPLALDAENFKVEVTSTEFDKAANEEVKKSEAAVAGAATRQQLLSFLPIAALLFVGFMVVKAIAKASKASNVLVAVSPDGQMIPLSTSAQHVYIEQDGRQVAVAANSPMALEAARKGQVLGQIDRDIRGAEGLVHGEEMDEKHAALKEFVDQNETIRIAKIPDHINVPLEQLKQLSTERPETVAMLLKTWLLNEGR
ncbi:MAG: flagellar M-ring protein FliF [Chthonomonas sp.]|nr:flagellar M-ring protein FliF [Chthonomonas sp.]